VKKKTKQWLKEIENSVDSLGKRMKAIEKIVHDKSEAHEQHEGPSSMGRGRPRGNKRNK
jgi:hypothetical protein